MVNAAKLGSVQAPGILADMAEAWIIGMQKPPNPLESRASVRLWSRVV